MNSVVLKNPDWDLAKSKFYEVDEYPLMSSPGTVLTIFAAYLVFVLKVGPSFMRKREPFRLTNTLIAYNGAQVALSMYLVYYHFTMLLAMGILPKKCYIQDDSYRKELLFGMWIYLAAKVSELLDTVFFVLRKKDNQITFLHLYHHSIMLIGTWACLKYAPSHTLSFIGFLNSLVHVLMYTYYALSALGPSMAKYLTWKKYMTTFQLVQFVSIIIQYLSTLKVSECPPSKPMAIFISANTFFFLILFLNFYRKNYSRKTKSKTTTNGNVCKINGEMNGTTVIGKLD